MEHEALTSWLSGPQIQEYSVFEKAVQVAFSQSRPSQAEIILKIRLFNFCRVHHSGVFVIT